MTSNNAFQAKKTRKLVDDRRACQKGSQEPPKASGTLTTRTVLSALPDTTSVDVGLNFNVVGGKSWALRMVTTGCERRSETW